MMFISYAQNFEDVMLHRALKHVDKGVYIDIGAQDPIVDSVSLAFYNLGWRGLHVEPASQYAAKLRSARPDEDVVEAAVGAEGGLLEIYEIKDTGLSTGKADIAERHRAAGFAVERRLVASIRLERLLDRFKDSDIHWLKIDVEGMEKDVIAGWGQSLVRPWIVVIESTQPLSLEPSFLDWESDLLTLGYRFAYFDGLNRFYVSLAHDELMAAFQAPPNVFDEFAVGPYATSIFASAFKSELKTAQASLEQVRVELAAAAEQLAVVNERKALADGDLAEARAELTFATEQLAAADERRALADGDLAEARAQLTSATERLVAADERRALAEDVLAETRAELTSATERLAAANERRARAESDLTRSRAEATSVSERLAVANNQYSSALAALAKMEDALGSARARPVHNYRMYIRWKAALFWLRLSPLLSSSRVDRLIHRAQKYAPPGTFDEESALARAHNQAIAASKAPASSDFVRAPSEMQARIAHLPPLSGQRIQTVHQFHSGSAVGDAITNGMLLLRTYLRSLGYHSEIFVEHRDPALSGRVLLIDDLPVTSEMILIVHHSMGHNAMERILTLPARKILLYHNITPPALLGDVAWARPYAELGRRQLEQMRPHTQAALADSEYNAMELRTAGYASPAACTFLFDVDDLMSRAAGRRKSTDDGPFTVLFVGRMVQSKGQADLVEAFGLFSRMWNKPCRLLLVGHTGSADALYPREVRRRIKQLGLNEQVTITGLVTDAELHAAYREAHVYVSLSRHEGFGVPLVEAMAHHLPVIAWPAGAVPYTLGHEDGNEAVLLADRSPATVAASIIQVAKNPTLASAMVERQLKVLERFRLSRQAPRLIEALIMAGARPPEHIEARRIINANMHMAVTGHTYGSYSLATVNRTMALALERRRPGRTRIITEEPSPQNDPPAARLGEVVAMASRDRPPTGPEVVISQNYPLLVPEPPVDLALAFTFWEESLLPEEMVTTLGKGFGKVLAPSRFVAKALIDSGVPINVETVGFVPDLCRFFKLADERPRQRPADAFSFLHVSSCFPRKGVDLLLAAYARAFRKDDAVRLIIKGFPNPHNDVAEQIERLRARDPGVAEIVMIDRELDDTAMLDLYRQADAMVLPTRGEGFNIPAAEAMAAGVPLIVTGFGGHLDFCGAQHARLLDFRFAPSGSHLATAGSVWVEPDVDELTAALKDVFADITSGGGVSMARALAARERIRTQLDPDNWADRVTRSAIDGLLAAPPPPLRVAWVSSWGVACGVAEYSRYLVAAMLERRDSRMAPPIVLTDERTAVSGHEEAVRILPAWRVGVAESMAQLARTVANEDPDAVVIQHQPGLIPWRALANLLEDSRLSNRLTVVTLHAAEHLLDVAETERSRVLAALGSATRVLVHRISDLDMLRGFGLTSNVTLFPQGAPGLALPSPLPVRELSAESTPIIGCYGFFLPGKGIPKLVEAFACLRQSWPKLRLRLVNAEYPALASAEEIAKCRALAQSLGVSESIEWRTEFTPNDVSMRELSGCDLLVMPYDHSRESSSAALRGAMASGVPLAVTPIAQFDDVGGAVHRLTGVDVASIVDGVDGLLRDHPARVRLKAAGARWLEENDWGPLGRRMAGMLLGLRASSGPKADATLRGTGGLGRELAEIDGGKAERETTPAPGHVQGASGLPARPEQATAVVPPATSLDYTTLTGNPPVPVSPPQGIKGSSRMCRQSDFSTDAFRYWMAQMKQPVAMQRKIWEWFFLADALYQRGVLRQASSGIGFGVGQEPLSALFASLGCNVLATDMSLEATGSAGWAKTGQHASELAALNARGVCDEAAFSERVRFRVMDMNDIPPDVAGAFDFCWSSCALEHLGSLERGLRFVEASMQTLKPGGIAVHTTEYNMSSNAETLELPELSLYRRRDLEGLVKRLEESGHFVEPFDWDHGHGFADGFIDLPPYFSTPLHLRLRIASFDCTSIGFIVHKGTRLPA